MNENDRHIRIKEVVSTTGRSRSDIYKKISEDLFPPPEVATGSFSAWSELEVQLYLQYMKVVPQGTKWSTFLEKRKDYGL